MIEEIILVDENDNPVGTCEKLQAHIDCKLHRAFSIFIFDSEQKMLLQKRHNEKYHSGGLWSNTCCSHQRAGTIFENSVHERLKLEMGFDCDLKEIFTFTYKVELGSGLWEHELDHVFIGEYNNKEITPNVHEVEDYIWIGKQELLRDIKINPQKYTYWFTHILEKVLVFI